MNAVTSKCLLIAGLAMLLAGPASGQMQNENLLVAVPDGYKIDFRDRNKEMLINEMVPVGETVNDWTEMVTVQIFYDLKVTPESFQAQGREFWENSCPGSHYQPIANTVENGYPVLVWLQACPRNKQTGKPEHTWFKAIRGNDSFYVVQKAFKFEPSREQNTQWTQYLRKISVCDSRIAERACPK
jgi:hypothetical protein